MPALEDLQKERKKLQKAADVIWDRLRNVDAKIKRVKATTARAGKDVWKVDRNKWAGRYNGKVKYFAAAYHDGEAQEAAEAYAKAGKIIRKR